MQIHEQLKRHEGFSSKPYRCTGGALTMGYGWNLEEGIEEHIAEFILVKQVSRIQWTLLQEFEWFPSKDLTHAQRDVITNMCYNLGIEGFKKFKKTIKAIEERDFEEAAKEMLDSKWAKQVGDRAIELAEQMRTGEYKE